MITLGIMHTKETGLTASSVYPQKKKLELTGGIAIDYASFTRRAALLLDFLHSSRFTRLTAGRLAS